MRSLFIVIFMVGCLTLSFSQPDNSDSAIYRIGHVKTMSQYRGLAGTDSSLVLEKTLHLDRGGRILEERECFADTLPRCICKYTYLEDGRISEVDISRYGTDQFLVYNYDQAGQLLRVDAMEDSLEYPLNVYSYYPDGSLMTTEYFQLKEGKASRWQRDSLSQDGLTLWSHDLEYGFWGITHYNPDGHAISFERRRSKLGEEVFKYVYHYNSRGFIAAQIYYDKGEEQWRITYDYDRSGKMTSYKLKTPFMEEEMDNVETWNLEGLTVEEIYYNMQMERPERLVYEYTYYY